MEGTNEREDWICLLQKWDKFHVKQRSKARILVRRGIPPSVRGQAWKTMSGALDIAKKNPGVYEFILKQKSPVGVPSLENLFPSFSENLKIGNGVETNAVKNILKAFAILDPEVRHQAITLLVGVLLSHMDEPDAFWVLFSLLKQPSLRGLFVLDLPHLKHTLYLFTHLVSAYLPNLYHHLSLQGVPQFFFYTEWFSTLFSAGFSPEITARIWDVLLLEGGDYLFAVGLAVLKTAEESLMGLGFDGILRKLKSHVAQVGPRLLVVADKFTNLEKTLRIFEEKFEKDRERIFFEENLDFCTELEIGIPKKEIMEEWFKNRMLYDSMGDGQEKNGISNNRNIPEKIKYSNAFSIQEDRESKNYKLKIPVPLDDGHELSLFG